MVKVDRKENKTMSRTLFSLFTLCILLTAMAGCASTQPTRFYVLHSLDSSETERQSPQAAEHGIAIGIGPVELPEYLNRPQIVTRISKDELRLSEFHRWASPLQHNFPSVLAENLSILLSTERVAIFPWKRSTQIDYRVTLEIIRFDCKPGGNASLIARWTIFGEDAKKALLIRRSSITEPVSGQDYEAIVSAKSKTLAALSLEIAKEIKAISQKAKK
jgi:hypothetical protein